MKAFNYIIQLWQASYVLLFSPRIHWQKVKHETDFQGGSFRRFLLPWLALLLVAVFLGSFWFESTYGFLFADTLIKAIRKILIVVLSFWGAIILIYEISRVFRVPVSFEISRKIALYASLPVILSMMFTALFPFAYIAGLAGFYALFVVYSAVNQLYKVHLSRNIKYLSVMLSMLFAVYALVAYLLSKLTAIIIY